MLRIEIKLVEEKLMRDMGSFGREMVTTNGFRQEAYELLNETPDCLEQNILEWLFEHPLSEINYKGITYKQFINKLKESEFFCSSKFPFNILFCQFVFYADSGCDDSILERSFGWTNKV